MGNIITTSLNLTNVPKELAVILDEAIKFNDKHFEDRFPLFEKLIPMPKELDIDAVFCNNIKTDEDLEKAINDEKWLLSRGLGPVGEAALDDANDEDRKERDENLRKSLANYKKYGYHDWLEWRCANWGSKWEADWLKVIKQSDTSYVVTFDTSHEVPHKIMEELAKYEGLEAEGWYCSEFIGDYCGIITITDGEYTDEEIDTIDFALECFGISREEYEASR